MHSEGANLHQTTNWNFVKSRISWHNYLWQLNERTNQPTNKQIHVICLAAKFGEHILN